jgi:hypothetical protein
VALLLALAVGAVFLVMAFANFGLHDMDAYWNAAMRIREGGAIYQPENGLHASALYRYAPWFAFAWVPMTYLPYGVVQIAWFVLLVAASIGTGFVVGRSGFIGTVAAMVLTPLLIWTACYGNVQPLMVASLVLGVERRTGPVWIAVAGSLKAAPIALVLVYLGRREWGKVAASLAIFALLVLPMVWLPGYTTNPGLTLSLFGWSPPLYIGISVATACAAVVLAQTRWAWTAGNVAVIAALPRLLLYDASFLLVGARHRTPADQGQVGR